MSLLATLLLLPFGRGVQFGGLSAQTQSPRKTPAKDELMCFLNNQGDLIIDWISGDTKEKLKMIVTEL